MSTETTNKKIKIDNGTTFGKTYTDKAVDERLQGLVSTATFTPVKEKANNSLQMPKGLTETVLVGVGKYGQEIIEIGDSLKLDGSKLSATGGGSGGGFEYDSITPNDEYTSYTGNITGDKAVYDTTLKCFLQGIQFGAGFYTNIGFSYTMSGVSIYVKQHRFAQNSINTTELYIQEKLYYHFITLTNSTSTFYSTFQNTSENKIITLDSLKTALAGKCFLCTGHTNSETAEYISGEGANIVVGVVDKSDNSTSGITIDSSFTIKDLVSDIITPLE